MKPKNENSKFLKYLIDVSLQNSIVGGITDIDEDEDEEDNMQVNSGQTLGTVVNPPATGSATTAAPSTTPRHSGSR